MSVEIMARIWWRADCTSTEKLVALSLADQAGDEDAKCWPSKAYIAERCCLSPRAVQNAIRGIEEKGWLKVEERSKQSNIYHFVLENLPPKPSRQCFEGVNFRESKGAPRSPQGAFDDILREHDVLPREQEVLPESIKETSLEPSTSLYAKTTILKLFAEAWNRIAEHHGPVPAIEQVDETREKAILLRVKEWSKGKTLADSIAVVEHVMMLVHESHYLTGRKVDWKATFDWLITKKNFRKVMEGNYDRNGNRPVQSTERNIHAAKVDSAELLRRRREQRAGSAAQYS